jgi:ribosomal protein S18 acetylase RimI-like enzyme
MSPALTFRDATEADLPAIVALLADDERGATREQPTDPLPPAYAAAFAEIERQEGNAVLIAERDGAIVGCLQLTVIPNLSHLGKKRALIEGVRVASVNRGQRIGEHLLGEAIRRAREAGCGLVQLTTNAARTDAQRFYKRLGFEASHVGMKLELG